ncbi:MAG: 3'(2'),5'-bisphosphate nucleotidase CysQ [Chthoniobacterales bacterium]|nr:3'(2'),5'-bisphosphate nucleotidase CysQ [Chthoniobacterales bacterium]
MIEQLKRIAEGAGREILRFYGKESSVEAKADNSPLTLADKASHEFISRALLDLDSSIPILSEEASQADYAARASWERFWLVDPMDGTKEFIKKTGEFTVNIALIEKTRPVIGMIYVPVQELFYWADPAGRAYKQQKSSGEAPAAIACRKAHLDHLAIVASRDHAGPAVKELLARFPDAETRSMGSSLKFCLVAEGKADVYLRDVPTMEWDTAAAQCVVEAAGGTVCSLDGKPLSYNKQVLRNPSILTLGDPTVSSMFSGHEYAIS